MRPKGKPRGGRDGSLTRYAWGSLGDVAEWLRSGLQSRLHRFDSGRRLMRDCRGFRGGVTPGSPVGEPVHADRELIEPGLLDVRGRRRVDAGMAQEGLSRPKAGVLRDVVSIRMTQQVRMNVRGYAGPERDVRDRPPDGLRA